jgi:hypothetical protein
MANTAQEVWQLLGELIQAQKETERKFQETDRKFQETTEEIRQVNRQLSQQLGELGGKWGLFLENMVAPACENIFRHWGIPVHQVSQRVKKRLNGDTLEIDVLVLNAENVLAVEVKSSLSVEDVKDFMADLGKFRQFFPEHSEKILYGAVAGMGIEEQSDRYAYRQGLFVLAQSGDSIKILNDAKFQPRAW